MHFLKQQTTLKKYNIKKNILTGKQLSILNYMSFYDELYNRQANNHAQIT